MPRNKTHRWNRKSDRDALDHLEALDEFMRSAPVTEAELRAMELDAGASFMLARRPSLQR